jgi:hypothetical protein
MSRIVGAISIFDTNSLILQRHTCYYDQSDRYAYRIARGTPGPRTKYGTLMSNSEQ